MERTAVTRDQQADRDDKLLERFQAMLERERKQQAEERAHDKKMLFYEIGEQFRIWSEKIHKERDDREPPRSPDEPKRGLRQHAVDMASGKHGGDLKWIGYGMIAIAIMGIMYVPWIKHFLPW